MGNFFPSENFDDALPFQKALDPSLGQGAAEGAKGLRHKDQGFIQKCRQPSVDDILPKSGPW